MPTTNFHEIKVNITIIFPADLIGNKVGGIETFLKGFIKYSPRDFDLNFVGISSNNAKLKLFDWNSVYIDKKEIKFLPLLFEKNENQKSFIPLSLRFALSLINRPLRMHHAILVFNRIEPAILFKYNKCPKIGFIHNDIQQQVYEGKSEVLWSKFPKLYSWIERNVFSFFDFIYTVNSKTLKYYKSKYEFLGDKFDFLPTWVDPEIFYPIKTEREELRAEIVENFSFMPKEVPWILFVGRLQEQKAPLRLIDSFFELKKKSLKGVLIIIGDGNQRRETEAHINKLGIQKDVFILGGVNQSSLAKFYRASDLLLLTSNFEGMPRCVLEALGCGIPVVTTNVGEVKRIVKNGYSGEIVETFEPKDIACSINKILDNPRVYSEANCICSIKDYSPTEVLQPLYDKIHKLFFERFIERKDSIMLLDCRIDNITFSGVLYEIDCLIRSNKYEYFVTCNVDHLVKLQNDGDFRKIYSDAFLTVADGIPILWAAKFLGIPLREKISGSDLFPVLCETAAQKGYKLFFLGGREGAAAKAAEVLKLKHPNLEIVGIYSPPFGFENDPVENKTIVSMILQAKPDILFVGLGAPKQEKWIYKYKDQYKVPVSIGIGISFEFIAGMVKRAPVWMQKVGLEWLWRFMMEPKRLWKRYLIEDMLFFYLILKEKFKYKDSNNENPY